jgi:predicted  nucleic acid-binding Zn-ribbon protein
MLEIVQQLLVVQDRDRRMAQLKAEHTRIPTEIAGVDKSIQDASGHLETLRNELKHIETERKKLEIDAEAKRAQITKYRTQLFQIKSNVEYQALLKEITKNEDDIKGIEDVELELMEKMEQLQPTLKEEQAVLKEVTGKAEGQKADLAKRATAIEQELAQLRTERATLVGTVEPEALSRYERLMRSKGDVAVVPILHGNCGGCHLNLPPQVVHNGKHGNELVSCDYCGRILYCPPD